MTGGDVGPLGKDAVNEVNKLFAWANQSKKGLILFVDEAEAFLRQGRGAATGAMSENVRNVLSVIIINCCFCLSSILSSGTPWLSLFIYSYPFYSISNNMCVF